MDNREATVLLDPVLDADRIDGAKELFTELWDTAETSSVETLRNFRVTLAGLPKTPSQDELIERSVGIVQPPNNNVDSVKQPSRRLFETTLRREVNEQYRPAFSEVARLLVQNAPSKATTHRTS